MTMSSFEVKNEDGTGNSSEKTNKAGMPSKSLSPPDGEAPVGEEEPYKDVPGDPTSGGGEGSRKGSFLPVRASPMTTKRLNKVFGEDNKTIGNKLVIEINSQVALFRDLLICVGNTRDGPELRERIRKVRRQLVDTCKHASQLLLPGIKNDVAEGIPVDNQNFVHLVSCVQLMSRELRKCHRLIKSMPVDMTDYYETKPGPSGLGGLGVISQLLLCKQLQPNFQEEEVCSIEKDNEDVQVILKEMLEFMPQEEVASRNLALTGEDMFSLWSKKRTRRSLYRNMSALCCTCKPTYL